MKQTIITVKFTPNIKRTKSANFKFGNAKHIHAPPYVRQWTENTYRTTLVYVDDNELLFLFIHSPRIHNTYQAKQVYTNVATVSSLWVHTHTNNEA